MSKLLVLGGSGRTGIHVLRIAAERGHHVRALVRNPNSLDVPPGVELIAGTPANIDDIRRAAEGTEAVIDALSNARASDSPWAKPVSPPAFMTDAARDVIRVMGEHDIRRLVIVSSQGVGDDWKRVSPVLRAVVKMSNIRAGFNDHNGVDQLVRQSVLDWTLARAVALTDKPGPGPVRAAEAGAERPGRWINRNDLARFLIETIEQGTWVQQAPMVWNATT